MRKTAANFAVFAMFVFSCFSCGIPTIPSKVAVKANPTFNLPISGDYFDKYLNDNVFDAIKQSNKNSLDLYDYYSDASKEDYIQTFLISQKIMDMELDLEKDITFDGEDAEIDKNFPMPSLRGSGNTVKMPLGGIFDAMVGPPQPNFPLGNLPVRTGGGTESLGFMLGVGFETAVFQSGGITLNFSPAVTVHSIGLYGSEGSTAALRQGTPTNPRVIDLAGENPLPKTVYIKITYTSSGSSAVTVSKSGSIGLSAATGVTLPSPGIKIDVKPDPMELNIGESGFLQGTIETGQFNITLPAGWDKFKISDTDFTLTQDKEKEYGGLNFNGKSGEPLAGQDLNAAKVTMVGTFRITADNASFKNVSGNTIDCTASLDIKEFSKVLIDGSADGMDLTQDVSINVDIRDMAKWVDYVEFSGEEDVEKNGVGLRFVVEEVAKGLQMAVSSKTLKINDAIPAPDYKPLEKEKVSYFTNRKNFEMHPNDEKEIPNGELDFTISFRVDPTTNNVLTLEKVTPETHCTVIKGEVEMVFDWIEAKINPGNEGKFTDKIGMDLNFGGGEGDILKDVAFEGVEAYLFIVGPDELKPNVYFDISYDNEGEKKHYKPFGEKGQKIPAIPEFDLDIDEAEKHRNLTVARRNMIGYEKNLMKKDEEGDKFDDILNSRSKMENNYTITVEDSLTIHPEDSASQKITVQLVILLPLQFKVNNPAGLVFDTFGDDLFQRGSKDDNSLFDTLKSMRFTLGFRKGEELFTGGKIYLVDESNINKPEEDPLGLLFNFSPNDNHNDGIYLDDAKISLVKDMYPYRLNFLIVPDEEEGGILAFRRNGRGGSIGVTVGLETDDVLSNF